MITALGKWILKLLLTGMGLVETIIQAFRNLFLSFKQGRRPIMAVLRKQIYFTGLESLKVIVIISVTIGIVIITQIISLVGANETLTGRVLVWVVIRELGPVLTAIIIIARSGTAIATELGYMKINNEIESIESLGIPADRYLIMPRIIGVTTSVVILTIYFEIAAILGGFVVAAIGWHVPFDKFAQSIFSILTLKELGMSFIKSLFFGLFLSAACCRHGLGVGKSATQIPQAATKGVMQSLFLVFVLDGIITLISLL
ncbi:ABC transporter permease [Geotalea toluenoxydans]|uniref:ABC transporter permease n=1 Tax=Geotalea toluenoxydans TaxID=421624 RepID=UPI0006D0B5E4|nr:ABC transporter permease [Geotalea toluenoxydans]